MYEATGAHEVDIHLTVVTQPGEDPTRVYDGLMRAVQDVCGRNAGVQTLDHDPEFTPRPMTSRPLFRYTPPSGGGE